MDWSYVWDFVPELSNSIDAEAADTSISMKITTKGPPDVFHFDPIVLYTIVCKENPELCAHIPEFLHKFENLDPLSPQTISFSESDSDILRLFFRKTLRDQRTKAPIKNHHEKKDLLTKIVVTINEHYDELIKIAVVVYEFLKLV